MKAGVVAILKAVQSISFPLHLVCVFGSFGMRTFVIPVQGFIHPGRFAIVPTWFGIYGWEIAALWFVARSPPTIAFWRNPIPVVLWCTTNVAEAAWAIVNAKGPLLPLPLLMGVATICHVSLGFTQRHTTGQEYWLSCAPFWFHAGWVTTVTMVNVSAYLATTSADIATQFNFAFASPIVACSLVLLAICVTVVMTGRVVATPYAVCVSWALLGVMVELSDSGRAAANPAWAQIGKTGQGRLQTVAGVCLAACAVLALGSAAALARNMAQAGTTWRLGDETVEEGEGHALNDDSQYQS